MKAVLKYNIEDPDQRQDFLRAVKSLDMAMAIWDILQLRKKMERCFDDDEGNAYDGIAIMANGIAEILEDHDISIDKLIN
jgi:hypothetical protein